jgi:hypothetical protein
MLITGSVSERIRAVHEVLGVVGAVTKVAQLKDIGGDDVIVDVDGVAQMQRVLVN